MCFVQSYIGVFPWKPVVLCIAEGPVVNDWDKKGDENASCF